MFQQEPKVCISPAVSFHLSYKEHKAVLMGVTSVLRHLVIGSLLVALDFLVFWILDQLHHQVKGDVGARAPAQVMVQVNGSGYASDIFRDLVASFNILQRGNITVISRKCLLEPSEPKYSTTFLLAQRRCDEMFPLRSEPNMMNVTRSEAEISSESNNPRKMDGAVGQIKMFPGSSLGKHLQVSREEKLDCFHAKVHPADALSAE
ncbi:hypothetical protein XENORESO_019343 [Xenotaenia resolanae]|uniref:Dendritic cell-specific transmembrane protein-like domain-containing protein n=1 Tax=Xenotaenia resolanae TaxID=208358 RepID=A0ABV0W3J9_9TELE